MAKMLIGGQWVEAADGRVLDMLAPGTGLKIGQIPRGGAADVDRAVAAAQAALDGEWGRLTATERGRLLMRLGDLILAHAEEIARIESEDTGKPLTQARNDAKVAGRYFEYYGSAADKIHGQTVPFLNGYSVTVLREPHGVTGHILPWNYPAQMFGRTLGPALAMGNAVVLKPSEDACLSTIRIAELAQEAGFPAGAINLVTGLGEESGAALSGHPGIHFMCFTGSPEVGTLVQQAAARNHIKVVLELGGKSPQVIFADADLDRALPVVINGIVQNAGQTCSAGSRLLIEKSIYDQVMAQVVERFRQIKVGSPEMDLTCGPVINAAQQRRVRGFIDEALAAGVPLLAEGQFAPDLPSGGFYVKPALFGPVPRGSRLACDEVFGPVLSAMPFDDEADAVRLANATDYGLVAGVWTSNGDRQQRLAKRIRVGQVFINCYGAGGGVELPFGGMKKSGHGREKGFVALEELSVTKTVVHHHQ